MFTMNETRLAANDGRTVKEFKKGESFPKSSLNEEIYESWERQGYLTELKTETESDTKQDSDQESKNEDDSEVKQDDNQESDSDQETETEKNVLESVEDLHKAKKKAGVK
jgi:ribosomal protein S8